MKRIILVASLCLAVSAMGNSKDPTKTVIQGEVGQPTHKYISTYE
jgi:hypothetical protein